MNVLGPFAKLWTWESSNVFSITENVVIVQSSKCRFEGVYIRLIHDQLFVHNFFALNAMEQKPITRKSFRI